MQLGFNYDSDDHAYGATYTSNTILDRDFAKFYRDGCRYISVSIYWILPEPSLGVYDDTFIDNIKRVVQRANLAGIRTFLSLHCAWGSSGTTWSIPEYCIDPYTLVRSGTALIRDTAIRTKFMAMFSYMTARIGVLTGLEGWLLNEPHWTTPSPYATDKENAIQLFVDINTVSLANCGVSCTPRFQPVRDTTDHSYNKWQELFGTGGTIDPRILALSERVCFNSYWPDQGGVDHPARLTEWKAITQANIQTVLDAGKKVFFTEFGEGYDDDDIQLYWTKQWHAWLISTGLPIEGALWWQWRADHASGGGIVGVSFNAALTWGGDGRKVYAYLVRYIPDASHPVLSNNLIGSL